MIEFETDGEIPGTRRWMPVLEISRSKARKPQAYATQFDAEQQIELFRETQPSTRFRAVPWAIHAESGRNRARMSRR